MSEAQSQASWIWHTLIILEAKIERPYRLSKRAVSREAIRKIIDEPTGTKIPLLHYEDSRQCG